MSDNNETLPAPYGKVEAIKKLRQDVKTRTGVCLGLRECQELVEMVEAYFTTDHINDELQMLRDKNQALRRGNQWLRRHYINDSHQFTLTELDNLT